MEKPSKPPERMPFIPLTIVTGVYQLISDNEVEVI